MAEYSTIYLAKNPTRGGIPAIENRQIARLRPKIGLAWNCPLSCEMNEISVVFAMPEPAVAALWIKYPIAKITKKAFKLVIEYCIK